MSPRPGRRVIATAFLMLGLVGSLAVGVNPSAAAAPTVPGASLVFATWNVCLVTCEAPAPPWSVRRERVARVIDRSGADVLSLDEATDIAYGSHTQWEDIQSFVAPLGYASPNIQDDRCKRYGCTHTARLLIRGANVQQLDFAGQPSAGYTRVGDVAPDVASERERQVAWAYLQGNTGTGPFLAIGVHLSTQKTAAGEQHRVTFGHEVTSWADSMNTARGISGIPVVLMGDFNSYQVRQPQGVQQILTEAGWGDSIKAPVRSNVRINAINYTPTQRSGWPLRPIYNKWRLATRIDYIMFRNGVTPLTYDVVVYRRADGSFDPDYQGSDHQMVRSRLQFS